MAHIRTHCHEVAMATDRVAYCYSTGSCSLPRWAVGQHSARSAPITLTQAANTTAQALPCPQKRLRGLHQQYGRTVPRTLVWAALHLHKRKRWAAR